MAILQIKNCKGSRGLTLIEVLIALAIAAIALTAVIKATSQNIRSSGYLETKTQAMWAGQEVLAEARAGVLKLPGLSDKLDGKTRILSRDWYWQASEEETPNKRINKVVVKVFARDESDNDEASPVITMETFVYAAD